MFFCVFLLAFAWRGDGWVTILIGLGVYLVLRFLRNRFISFFVAEHFISGPPDGYPSPGAALACAAGYAALFGYTAHVYLDGWAPVGGIAFGGFLLGVLVYDRTARRFVRQAMNY
ncbi:hypothetical protein ACFWUP_17155 [Nocardia sp. NPDC058658]|uniref:hypothetical protein n=1 Tax=Nocardia sp. NPDC058658 TaxID=3346580 RepID=UPI0036657279